MTIRISDTFSERCPHFVGAVLSCEVVNSNSDKELWIEIDQEVERIKSTYSLEAINKRTEIATTRNAYKTLGKDPNRYRPSAEALCRRISKDRSLYRVNTLVDSINLISIRTGYSIGGFDTEQIRGNLELGVGNETDEFEAIGRGILNITGLPVYRDEIGGIGTPTSDNERTKITVDTKHLTMIINDYSNLGQLQSAIDFSIALLQKYAKLGKYQVQLIDKQP